MSFQNTRGVWATEAYVPTF